MYEELPGTYTSNITFHIHSDENISKQCDDHRIAHWSKDNFTETKSIVNLDKLVLKTYCFRFSYCSRSYNICNYDNCDHCKFDHYMSIKFSSWDEWKLYINEHITKFEQKAKEMIERKDKAMANRLFFAIIQNLNYGYSYSTNSYYNAKLFRNYAVNVLKIEGIKAIYTESGLKLCFK